MMIMLQPAILKAQYHKGNSNFSAIATSQAGLSDLNCDTRNFNYTYTGANQNSPLHAVAWDGQTPGIYWDWTDGLGGPFYSNTISLPNGAYGADVVVLYNNTLVNEPYIAVVYALLSGGTLSSIVFKLYQFNPASPGFSLYYSTSYSCNTAWFPRIDADSRGYFAFAWESNYALHTVAGKLSSTSGPIVLGQEKTLIIPSTPSGCTAIVYPDVALYGKNNTNSQNRIYYTYMRCTVNQTLTVQTQVFSDIFSGTGTPPSPSPYYNYTTSGNNVFGGPPRIASNMYTSTSSSNNGAEDNEYTVVCTMGNTTNYENSIFAMTSMQNSGTQVTSEYNVTTDNFTGSPDYQASFYNVNNYTTPENFSVSNATLSYNYAPVVAYDRDNNHVVICWSMEYGETLHSSDFPLGTFPAHVYANPVYNKNSSSAPNNYPSMQADINIFGFAGCEINGLDDTPGGSNSNSTYLVAVSCHNTNDLLYAWYNSNGDIVTKIVTSGSQPRLSENHEINKGTFIFPNPVNKENGIIHLNIQTDQKYILNLFNLLGESLFSVTGNKYDLEVQLSANLKKYNPGMYQVNLLNEKQELINSKISLY